MMVGNLDTGILALGAFIVTLLVHAVVISRWSAKLDTIVKQLQSEMEKIGNIVIRHDREIENLRINVEVERQVRAAMDRQLNNGRGSE